MKTKTQKPVLEWNSSDCYMEAEDEPETFIYNEFALEDFLSELSELLEQFNPNGYWHCRVQNFGWMNSNGEKYFQETDGQKFLNNILPKTDCSFKIYKFRNELKIQNFHHDSPTGNEWYYCKRISGREFDKNN